MSLGRWARKVSPNWRMPSASAFKTGSESNRAVKRSRSAAVISPSSQRIRSWSSVGVFISVFQQFLEFLAGIEQPRHDRAQGTRHHLRNFLISQAIDLPQEDNLPVIRAKFGNGGADAVAQFSP